MSLAVRSFLLLGSAWLAAGAAAGPPAPSPDIVVNGREQLNHRQVRQFTRSISPMTKDQMARMINGFCPSVFGMPEPYGRIVADRMKQDASQLGVPPAKPDCKPNALLIFAEDAHALIDSIRHDNRSLFGSLTQHDIRRLAESSGPAFAWSNTSIRDEDGANVSGGRIGQSEAMVEKVPAAHIMDLPTLQNIDWSVIVIEQSAAIGKSLTQLADYAAMRTLTQADVPAAAPPGDTILLLFRTPNPPAELTRFDRGYIFGLYAGKANKTYTAKLGSIAHGINRNDDASASDSAQSAK